MTTEKPIRVQRVQTGLRVEKRMLKVLKALAEYHDLTLADLVEGIVLHALEGGSPFQGERAHKVISELKGVYGMDYGVEASHRLTEGER